MRNPNYQFWAEKRVFLTGHTGFKGSWMVLYLNKLGAKVTGYALDPPTNPSLFNELNLKTKVHSVIGDIRDVKFLERSLIAANPEIVIHMAAQPLVRDSYLNPRETYEINVLGTLNVLEACRKALDLKAILNITTDKCYENKEWIWPYRETDHLGGFDPYSSSKACSEILTSAYDRSFFSRGDLKVSIATGRAGNVIGGGDWAKDRLIPDYFRARAEGRTLDVRNPNSIRPWQHVLEPLTGYLLLLEELYSGGNDFAEPFNFGPDQKDCRSVKWICEKLDQILIVENGFHIQQGNHPHEANFLKLDSSKAQSKLGWQPRWGLNKALETIVSWQEAWRNKEDVFSVINDQLESYLQTKIKTD